MRTICRVAAASIAALVAAVVAAGPAAACGGLVGENGTIRLERTTTLAAYHDGVERYVTSFEFTGAGTSLGSIVPLPGVPSKVERGGDWTLQRLRLEVQPPVVLAARAGAGVAASATDQAKVILEATVDALDITVLEGGGTAVGKWAIDNGFLLTPDAPEVLDFYAQRSPIFMAAKFDARRASALGQNRGDGTPIMLTIPTERPWVPLRILGLGQDPAADIRADVFLLTDDRPRILTGSGVTLARSEAARARLLDDLRRDKNMEWVPRSQWLSYLKIDAKAGSLTYDLSAGVGGSTPSHLAAAVPSPPTRVAPPPANRSEWLAWSVLVIVIAGVGVLTAVQIRSAQLSSTR